METIGNGWMWAGFAAVILVMLAIDIVVTGGGRKHRVSFREAAIWSGVWVGVSLIFAGALWWHLDSTLGRIVANERALEFITGYLIEKSLAVDNVFVWMMLFSYFAIPAELQRRVLLFGVFGAIVLRTAMIFAGVWLIAQFHWLLYVFGVFLLVTGVKMWRAAEREFDLAHNPVLHWMKRHLRLTDHLEGERFLVARNEGGKRVLYLTPLFLVLVLVEISDVIFAVDSIPAIFAITTDPFIVLTSNIFAILGLRAMYFLLAGMAERFSMLKYGLALALVFIGAKMLLMDLYKIPVLVSLSVVAAIIATSVVLSLRRSGRRHTERTAENRA